MYQYKFEKVNIDGLIKRANYKEVIMKNAKEGWRFVQLIEVYVNGNGKPIEHEAIFEKELN